MVKTHHAIGRVFLFGIGGVAVLLVGCLVAVSVWCFQDGFGIHAFKTLPSAATLVHGFFIAVSLLLAIGAFGCVALCCWSLAVAPDHESAGNR